MRGAHGYKYADGAKKGQYKEDPLELGHKIDKADLKMENYVTLEKEDMTHSMNFNW